MNNSNPKTDDTNAAIFFLILFTSIICIIIGGIIGACNCVRIYQREAIEYGYAEFDNVTGEWQWKQSIEKTEEDK